MSTALEIKEAVEAQLFAIPGVTGIGLSRSSPDSINIYLERSCPKITCNIPDEIGGVPVKQIVTGRIMALNQIQILEPMTISRTDKFRPAPPGVSIGHPLVTAGTFGVLCYDNTTGAPLILSNNHILAAKNSNLAHTAKKGDTIVQPGIYDGGNPATDKIGELERWIDLDVKMGGTDRNDVDCAVARPTLSSDITDNILGIGKVTEIAEPHIGDIVIKSGRTSGLTEGAVVDVNATVKVDYRSEFAEVFFQNQIVILPSIIDGGDSGSLLVRKSDNKAVGLCFAGTSTIAIANRMTLVAEALNINLGGSSSQPGEGEPGGFWGTVGAMAVLPMVFGIVKRKGKTRRRNWK